MAAVAAVHEVGALEQEGGPGDDGRLGLRENVRERNGPPVSECGWRERIAGGRARAVQSERNELALFLMRLTIELSPGSWALLLIVFARALPARPGHVPDRERRR